MSMNALHPSSRFHINRAKLRLTGTFLVPIGAMLLLLTLFSCLSVGLTLILPEYGKLNDFAIQWSGVSFFPWGIFTELAARIVILIIVFTYLHKSEKILPKDFGLVWSPGQEGIKGAVKLNIVIIAFLFFLFSALFNFSYHLSGQEAVNDITNFLFNCYHGKIEVSSIVSGSAFEEILFRGIYCTLLIRYGFKWKSTILMTGIIFGLVHLVNSQTHLAAHIIQTCFATVVGWFLGWVFYKTRTLAMPMLWHYLINIVIDFGAVRPDILAKIAKHLII